MLRYCVSPCKTSLTLGNDDAEDGGADGDEEEGAEPKATRKVRNHLTPSPIY